MNLVVDFLKDSIQKELKIGIYGDYDTDGLFSLMILKDTFKQIGVQNFMCFPYKNRTHEIDSSFLNFCLLNNIEVAIICDTGSSNLELLERFSNYGVSCIVLDHHRTQLRYKQFPESVKVINTFLDSVEHKIENKMCGAAVTLVVCSELMDSLKIDYDIGYFACYALIAMYADCIPMDTTFGRSLYDACETRLSVPFTIDLFLGEHQTICRRFAEYWLAPKINTVFRREQFYLINNLFINEIGDSFSIVKEMENLHITTIDMVKAITKDVTYEVYGDIIVADLSSLLNKKFPANFILNHKGRIANELCNLTGKPCICVCDSGLGIEGSLRDLQGRDFLRYFSHLFRAGGHGPAFGFVLNYMEWDLFANIVRDIKVNSIEIVLNDNEVVDMTRALDLFEIDEIAKRNEFSTSENPPTYVYVRLPRIVESHKYADYGYLLTTDNFSSVWVSSSKKILYPQNVVVYPYKSTKTKLQVVWR